MNSNMLLIAFICSLSLSSLHSFTIVYDLRCPLTLHLDWYARNEATQTMEVVTSSSPLSLDAILGTETIDLSGQYDQVHVTLIQKDGLQQAPVVLEIEDPYEQDKHIDDSCRLVLFETPKGMMFKLRGKKFVKIFKKSALVKKLSNDEVKD